jgi:hypothetical protein
MKTICKSICYLGLPATVVPSILVFSRGAGLNTHKAIMGIGMVAWFVTAPLWMKK